VIPDEGDSITAAGSRRPAGQRLGRLDARLLDRLTELADRTVARMVDRAGHRIVSVLSSEKSSDPRRIQARDLIRHVPEKSKVAAVLGRQRLAELSIDAEAQLETDLAEIEQRWEVWLREAQRSARRISTASLDLDEREEDAFEERQDEHRRAAWPLFAAAILTAARAQLFSPVEPGAPRVAPGTVREALARAGGASPQVAPNGAVTDPRTGGAVGLVATGEDVAELWGAHGQPWKGYRWVHDDPEREFPPHEALNGVEFTEYESAELSTAGTDGEWLGEFFYPGDHAGCLCTLEPLTE
jgi:hypothetical protein